MQTDYQARLIPAPPEWDIIIDDDVEIEIMDDLNLVDDSAESSLAA